MQDRRRGGKVTMGYPVEMIGANTALFSLIGTDAIEHKHDTLFNDYFKAMDVDCKMMPLNIREDDIGFFLNGLKDSQIKAVYFEKEYWEKIYTLLPTSNEEINFCKICDTIDIKDGNYEMRLSIGEAIVSRIEDMQNKTIMIIGSTPEAKSTLLHLIKHNPQKIILAHEVVEELLEMIARIPENISHDIIRIEKTLPEEISDITLNFNAKPYPCTLDINQDFDKILTEIAKINTKKWSLYG